jgi:protoheme IX farnesyltransferase
MGQEKGGEVNGSGGGLGLISAYIKLTSPGITMLVTLTGFIGMWIASRGAGGINPGLFLWALLGLALASSGSSVFNNYYDRDIDRVMKRTSGRPLPDGRIRPSNALLFGIALSLTAFGIMAVFVNMMSALLVIAAIFTYSFVYTVILKRRTPLATEIGGISGALPPLIGWAAVRNGVGFEAWLLFIIMFLWQPPHFWSLALRYRDDYKRAKIPTMSAVRSGTEITIRSLLYVASLVCASFMPYFIGMFNDIYFIAAMILGAIYVAGYMFALFSKKDMNRQLFAYSIIYLSLLFISMAADAVI